MQCASRACRHGRIAGGCWRTHESVASPSMRRQRRGSAFPQPYAVLCVLCLCGLRCLLRVLCCVYVVRCTPPVASRRAAPRKPRRPRGLPCTRSAAHRPTRQHRFGTKSTHSTSPSDAAPLQLALCVRVAELYPKNYFAWTHRQACSRALKAHASCQSNRVQSTAVPSAGGCERQACGVCMVCRVPRAACDARL